MSLSEYNYDVLSLIASILMLALYHAYLAWRLRRDPYYTIQGVNAAARRAWVAYIMETPSAGILGVQTLRNSTMAATFLASTAVLLIMGTLTLSSQSDRLTASWHLLNVGGSVHPELWIAKVLMLLTDFLVAFFSAAMAIRLFNHVGFQLNVPPEHRPVALGWSCVATHLNRAGRFYSISMRAFYFSVPLVFWLFGPVFMLCSAVVLVAVLYKVDRTPRGQWRELVEANHRK